MTTETPPETDETTEAPAIEVLEEDQPTEGGEMTLIEHLLELRTRVTWIAASVVVGMALFFAPPIGFRAIEFLLVPARNSNPDFIPQFIEPMENLLAYFRVALMGGIAVAMPMIVYHAMRFVTPALTKSERRWVFPIVFGASFAFLAGMAFAYWAVLPFTLGFLLNFGSDFAVADWRIGNYIGFVTRIILVMGVVFETPLIVMGLARFGVVTYQQLLRWWRFAIVFCFIVAAIVTPPEPITQLFVGVPMILLYFFGILLAYLVRKREPAA